MNKLDGIKEYSEGIEQKRELEADEKGAKKTEIKLSAHEIQSNLNRVKAAEGLIEHLPDTHDGRNTWLMNYGVREISQAIRANDAQKYKDAGYDPRVLTWNDETECLNSVT